MKTFTSESELTETATTSKEFYDSLGYQDWHRWERRELKGYFGIPDYVVAFGKKKKNGVPLIRAFAFEMKLKDWKRAIIQAYKYTSFAHYSYVVMDHYYIERAKRNIQMFERSNIGLTSIDTDGNFYVHLKPKFQSPYSDRLKKKLSIKVSNTIGC